MRSKLRSIWFCVVLPSLVGACHNVIALPELNPTPGRVVVITMREPIEFQVVEARLQNLNRAEGTFLANDADSLVVSAQYLWSMFGVKHPALGARVAVPKHNIVTMHEKQFSTWKTALLAIGGAGALIGSIFLVSGGSGGNPSGGPPGQPPTQ